MDTIEATKRTRVRAYPSEFKARLVAECEQAGASVAKVALAHGINANMLHTWRREVRGPAAAAPAVRAEFVPLALGTAMAVPDTPIRIDLRHGATTMTITWPSAAAAECATWMRELLR